MMVNRDVDVLIDADSLMFFLGLHQQWKLKNMVNREVDRTEISLDKNRYHY